MTMRHMPSLPSFLRGKRSLRKLFDSRSDENRASPAVSPSSEGRHTQRRASGANENEGKPRTPSKQAQVIQTAPIQPKPPTQADVLQTRQELDSVLSRLGDLLEEVPSDPSDESLSLSISLYVDDIRRKSKALNTVSSAKQISPKRSEESISLSPDAAVEQPRCVSHLPTPDFDGSFDIDLRQFSHEESPSRGSGNAGSLSVADQGHSPSPSATPMPLHIAPLQLPRRSTSLSSFNNPRKQNTTTSPFCREIHELDAHINASRRESRRSSSKPPQCHLRARTLDLNHRLVDPPCPAPRPLNRQVSLDDHKTLLQRYEKRQFSTEEKAQRLRCLRATSSTLHPHHSHARPEAARGCSPETLSMDELMGFLREGNSLREL